MCRYHVLLIYASRITVPTVVFFLARFGYVLYSILCITSDNRNATSLINPVAPLINQVVS